MPIMKVTEENPFRVLGLSLNASDRQITKRVNELTTLYEFGKSKEYDTDFPFISGLTRSPEAIERAARQIELPDQKIFYASYWFWNDNSVDELVYEVLKAGGVEKATELWGRQIQDSELSKKNYSNYKNLALLNLLLALKGDEPDFEKLGLAISQFMGFYSNPSYAEFCAEVSGKTHKQETLASTKTFIDELAKHLNLINGSANAGKANKFISSFSVASAEIQNYVKSRFSEAPIHRIEKQLEETIQYRRKYPDDTYKKAKDFYLKILPDLQFLKTALTTSDVHYRSIADRIADELLQCSTVYYNAHHEGDETTGIIDRSKEITLLAQKVAAGEAAKNKVRDDLATIKKLRQSAEVAPMGDAILSALKILMTSNSFSQAQVNRIPSLANAAINTCQPILVKMKSLVGEHDENYVFLSDLVVNVCLSGCIKFANDTNNFREVLPVLERLGPLKMTAETRQRLTTNKRILSKNLTVVSQQSSGGCYIATMAYGSYESPEVLVLRRFRDKTLSTTAVGRAFIKIYYATSPSLVLRLKNREKSQNLIRYMLDKIVKVLS